VSLLREAYEKRIGTGPRHLYTLRLHLAGGIATSVLSTSLPRNQP